MKILSQYQDINAVFTKAQNDLITIEREYNQKYSKILPSYILALSFLKNCFKNIVKMVAEIEKVILAEEIDEK